MGVIPAGDIFDLGSELISLFHRLTNIKNILVFGDGEFRDQWVPERFVQQKRDDGLLTIGDIALEGKVPFKNE